MNPTKYATDRLRKYACGELRRPVGWLARWVPRPVWLTLELAGLGAVMVTGLAGAVAAWAQVAALGAPWWVGAIAAGFPAGALARLAKEAGRWRHSYCNWRDHTLDNVANHQPAVPAARPSAEAVMAAGRDRTVNVAAIPTRTAGPAGDLPGEASRP